MKLVEFKGTGIKPRPIWINPEHVVYVTSGFQENTEITTLASGDKARVAVSEAAAHVVKMLSEAK